MSLLWSKKKIFCLSRVDFTLINQTVFRQTCFSFLFIPFSTITKSCLLCIYYLYLPLFVYSSCRKITFVLRNKAGSLVSSYYRETLLISVLLWLVRFLNKNKRNILSCPSMFVLIVIMLVVLVSCFVLYSFFVFHLVDCRLPTIYLHFCTMSNTSLANWSGQTNNALTECFMLVGSVMFRGTLNLFFIRVGIA